MTIQEIFIGSNEELLKSISQIKDDQWELIMPEGTTISPSNLKTAVQRNVYDDAWVPDVLDGKTKEQVGDQYEALLSDDNVRTNYTRYNQRANDAVRTFTDLERVTHLSYGDFSARDYLQHIISFRAFRAYDIATLIGVDIVMPDDLVQALLDEFSPVVEGFRQMGVFPPAIEVPDDARPQVRLMAMVGRS